MHAKGMARRHGTTLWRYLRLCISILLIGVVLPVTTATSQPKWAGAVSTPLLTAVDASAAQSRWLPPLGSPLRITGPYRAPPSPYASGHRGIDLPARPGMSVVSPAAGTVSFVGKVVDREVLSIQVDQATVVSIEPISPAETLSAGESVSRGQEVGTVSTGGHCAAECLHIGVRVHGEYVNPGRFFVAKPVLLPW